MTWYSQSSCLRCLSAGNTGLNTMSCLVHMVLGMNPGLKQHANPYATTEPHPSPLIYLFFCISSSPLPFSPALPFCSLLPFIVLDWRFCWLQRCIRSWREKGEFTRGLWVLKSCGVIERLASPGNMNGCKHGGPGNRQ